MTDLQDANYISSPDRTEGEGKQFLEDVLQRLKEVPGGAAISELTIATGVITPTGAFHTVDTEADAGTDTLTTLALTNLSQGAIVDLYAANAGRVVTVQHLNSGADGQISLAGGANLDLSTTQALKLRRVGSQWEQVVPLGGGGGGGASGYFHVHKNDVDQAGIAASTDTALTWATEVADESNTFDLGNGEHTPTAGLWEYEACTQFENANIVDGELFQARLYRNTGGGYALFQTPISVRSAAAQSVRVGVAQFYVQANGTDKYKIYVRGQGTGDKTIDGSTANTWWKGVKLA